MQKIFQIEKKKRAARNKPSPVRASRKARDCGSSWFSEVETATAAAAAAVEFDSFFSSTISAIPRTLEAQKIAHRNFRIDSSLAPALTATTGREVENEAEDEDEEEIKGLEMCEEEKEERVEEEGDAERINITTD